VAAYYAVAYVAVALLRLKYPFELEWMEGGMVGHVWRVLQGKPLYVAPSIDFVPYLYTPLYYYASALVAHATGIGFLPLRIVSVAASAGIAGLVFFLVHRQSRSLYAAFMGMAFFLATYKISGSWLDIARVDSLYTLFLLAGFTLFLLSDHRGNAAFSGVLFALAFLTKQSALSVVAAFFFLALFQKPRAVLSAGAAFFLVSGASTAALWAGSDGWYGYYVFFLPFGHPLIWEQWMDLVYGDYIKYFLPLLVLAGLLWRARQGKGSLLRTYGLHLSFAAALLVSSFFSRLHSMGYVNCLLPFYAGLAMLFAFVVHQAMHAGVGIMFRVLVALLTISQFALLFYNPLQEIPTEGDRMAGARFIERVRKVEGDVLITAHGFYGRMAGKNIYAHGAAVQDVLRSKGRSDVRTLLERSIRSAVAGKDFSALILSEGCHGYPTLFDERSDVKYLSIPIRYSSGREFVPVTGCHSRPTLIWHFLD
jgi:hypothetical protein